MRPWLFRPFPAHFLLFASILKHAFCVTLASCILSAVRKPDSMILHILLVPLSLISLHRKFCPGQWGWNSFTPSHIAIERKSAPLHVKSIEQSDIFVYFFCHLTRETWEIIEKMDKYHQISWNFSQIDQKVTWNLRDTPNRGLFMDKWHAIFHKSTTIDMSFSAVNQW